MHQSEVNGIFIAFIGMPGVGKSTLAKELALILNAHAFIEPEDGAWPIDHAQPIEQQIEKLERWVCETNRKNFTQARELANQGRKAISDGGIFLANKNFIYADCCNWYYGKISEQAKVIGYQNALLDWDSKIICPDILVLLETDKKTWQTFLKMRNRKIDDNELFIKNYAEQQTLMAKSAEQYAQHHNIQLIRFTNKISSPKDNAMQLKTRIFTVTNDHRETVPLEINYANIFDCNQSFIFDWRDERTFADSKSKIENILKFLDSDPLLFLLTDRTMRENLTQLQYKIGTFFLYCEQQPKLAELYLEEAKRGLTGEMLAFTLTHLALINLINLVSAKKSNNEREAHDYFIQTDRYCSAAKNCLIRINGELKIIANHACEPAAYANHIQSLAYAYCDNLEPAIVYSRNAVKNYEQAKIMNNVYFKAKLDLAMLFRHAEQIKAAKQTFLALKDILNTNEINTNLRESFLKAYTDFQKEQPTQQDPSIKKTSKEKVPAFKFFNCTCAIPKKSLSEIKDLKFNK